MFARRSVLLLLAALPLLSVGGCGKGWWDVKNTDDKQTFVAPPQPDAVAAPPAFPTTPSAHGGALTADAENQRNEHMHPIPHPDREVTPATHDLVHPQVAPIDEPKTLPEAEKNIPISIIGTWKDDRGAEVTFTNDGRFEIDAKSPDGSTMRANGNYLLEGAKATMAYANLDIDSNNPQTVENLPKIKDEFMKKGPGAVPQIQAIEMKSKDEFLMRTKTPGANPTVMDLKRKS